MKTLLSETIRSLALAVASAFWFHAATAPAQNGEPAATAEYAHVLQPESGAAEFVPGDQITITSLRGDRDHLEPGGHYLLEGSYTLASADSADLAWFATTRGPSGPTPVTDYEHVPINRGSGNFHLEKTLLDDGWLHVSFYVGGHSQGGIYFGEHGVESTVLRQKSWSDISDHSGADQPERESSAHDGGGAHPNPANLAIMTYLGDPVPPPARLDASYSPTNLIAAFTELSKKQGLRIEKLSVDDSEFPFLVYGTLAGRHEFRVLEEGLRQMKGYDYCGSVVGGTAGGGTYFALSMTPQSQYPRGDGGACNRRLMIRLQMLADAVQKAR